MSIFFSLCRITLASLIAVQIIAALYDPGDDNEGLNGNKLKKYGAKIPPPKKPEIFLRKFFFGHYYE